MSSETEQGGHMLRGNGLDVIDVQDTSKSWIRYARHLVGIAMLMLASPEVVLYGGGVDGWVSLVVILVLIAFALAGLYALFFTKRAKRNWPSSLFRVAWTLTVLYLLGSWSPFFGAKTTTHSATPASEQAAPKAPQGNVEPEHLSEPIAWEKGVITPPQVSQAQPATSDAETTAHYQAIYQAHPDADAVANSAQFQHWLTMYPAYRAVMDKGTAQQIIEMFTAFKMQGQQTFDPATARPVTQ